MPPALTDQQVATRRRYARLWAGASVAWSLARTAVVWAALSGYGVNPWLYLCVDLCSAAVLAVSMPRLVTSLIDRRPRRAVGWAVVTLVGYVVPDVYIFLASEHLPWLAIAVVLGSVYVSIAVAAVGVRRRVLAGRAERAKAESVVLT